MVSEVRKGRRCNPGVAAWLAGISAEEIYLSVLTLGEIRRGIENLRRRDQPAATGLETWLAELVAAYSGRCLPIDQEIADAWGRFGVPSQLPVIDSLLAATALIHGLTLVTRNLKDVKRSGVDCLNPFSG